MTGSMDDLFPALMNALTGKKITIPGTFVG